MPDRASVVDYVLVASKQTLSNLENTKILTNFVNGLYDKGVTIEMSFGEAFPDNLFIRLRIPDTLVVYLASEYHVELSYNNPNYESARRPRFKMCETELDRKDESKLAYRNPETFMDLRPTKPTNAERSMLLYTLMARIWFDENVEDYGIDRLLSRGLLVAAYPVHDGQDEWTTEGPLNDRQILAKYWSGFLCLFKKQPLNLIEKYFGTEIALYFAYLDFYLKFMMPAALLGVVVYFCGLCNAYIVNYPVIEQEVCQSRIQICPLCNDRKICKYIMFNNYCGLQKTRAALDNTFTALYAIIMSVWGIFFAFFWKRRLNVLRLRWNLFDVRLEKGLRPEFIAKTKYTRINTATGIPEYYIPPHTRCCILTWTNVCIFLIGIFFMLFAMAVVVYQNRLTYRLTNTQEKKIKEKARLGLMIGNALVTVIQILVFSMSYPKLTYFFTNLETPSTQHNFDNSYILKYCVLLFANSFSAITYLTFIRGRSYGHPGEVHEDMFLREITHDLCGPTGCFTDLGVTLGAIFFVGGLKYLFNQSFFPMIKVLFKKKTSKKYKESLPQWEKDFILAPPTKFRLFSEYLHLLVTYGYILCFVNAFPLAPFLSVLKNIFEIRVDARKFLLYTRRMTPKKVRGLGSYSKVFKWVTYIGAFTNACVIAFASSFISFFAYKFIIKSKKSYYEFMLSEFSTSDLPHKHSSDVATCYYPGIRYGPEDSKKYTLSTDYYIVLVSQLLFILIYEQLLIFIRTMLRESLDEKPKTVKEKIKYQHELVQEARQKILNDLYKEAASQKFSSNIRVPTA